MPECPIEVPFIPYDDRLNPVPQDLDTNSSLITYLSKILIRFIKIDKNFELLAQQMFNYNPEVDILYSWLVLQYDIRRLLCLKLLEMASQENFFHR